MKSSKKFMTRVLTAALALSMIAGTGICAAAVEEPVEEEPLVISPYDGEETPDSLSKLDTVKAMLAQAVQNVYAKFSRTTAAQLIAIAQEIKMSQKIMVEASNQAAAIQTEAYTQAAEIMAEATEAVEGLEDEEAIVQIMHEAEDRADAVVKAAEEQAAQIMAEAQATSDALLADANAQLDTIKAKVQGKAAQTIAAIQQQIELAKAQIRALAQKAAEFVSDKLVKVVTVTEGDFTFNVLYSLKGVSAMATAYNGEEEEVTIPAYVKGCIPVREARMFSTANIKTLNFPDTVTHISGLCAVMFKELQNMNVDENNPYYQSIDGIVFDKSGTVLCAVPQGREYNAPEGTLGIGDFAYYMSPMSSFEIPSTVLFIGVRSFGVCENLEEIEIPEGVVSLGEGAFQYCSNLKKAFVPESVQTIGDFAFSQSSDDFVMDLETISCQAYVYARENNIPYNCPLAVSLRLEPENEFVDFASITLGTSVTVTAEAEGGSKEGYTYAFYTRKEGDTKWTCRQGFKNNASIVFNPQFTGSYDLCVKVKDSEGNTAKMYQYLGVVSAFENTTTISADTIKKGKTVTVNCSADGVAEDEVVYAVYYKKTTDKKWTTKQDYAENTEVTVKPAKAADYIICVKAKNINDGTISKQYFNVKVTA